MSRLPVPGEDTDIWGDVLNDFLSVSHLPDGSIKPSAVPAAQVADATSSSKGVVQLAGDLGGSAAAPTVPGLAGKYTKPAGGIPETDLDSNVQTKLNSGGSVGDATSSTKGVLQLAGDLGGTAAAPTVPGLATKVDTSLLGANNGVATLDSSGKVTASQLTAASDATTSSKGIVQLAGDLGGTAAAPTVPALASKINNSEKGALNGVATLDGTGKVTATQLPTTADATTTSKGIVQLAGDLGGTAASPTVPGLASKVDSSLLGANNGVATLDSSGKVTASQITATADATATTKGVLQLAGDLGGTAAAPTVPGLASKVNTSLLGANNGVATLDSSGKVTASQITATPDATSTSKGIIQLAGDLGGTAASPTVPGLSGKVNTTSVGAANGVASLDGTTKVPLTQLPDATTSTKGIVELAGDLGGTAAAPTVPALTNKADKATTITAGSGLTGGGDLSANRTLAVSFGTIAGTVAAGNDSRITGAEQTSNKGVANGYAGLDGSGHVPLGQLAIGSRIQPFSSSGLLIVETGTHRLYNDSSAAWTILSVRASVGVAPTGSSIIVDVKINGTTIFTTQANRPTIAAAAFTSGKITNMDVTSVASGSYLTVDVAQVGSTTPGTDLTVQVEVQ